MERGTMSREVGGSVGQGALQQVGRSEIGAPGDTLVRSSRELISAGCVLVFL